MNLLIVYKWFRIKRRKSLISIGSDRDKSLNREIKNWFREKILIMLRIPIINSLLIQKLCNHNYNN